MMKGCQPQIVGATRACQPRHQGRKRASAGAWMSCVLLSLAVWTMSALVPSQARADLAKAKGHADAAMKLFSQKKYMAAVRRHGQAMGELPDNAHAARARSLYYIGLCYQKLKYKSYAIDAWKRFLQEVKKVPNADQSQEWGPRIRAAKAAIAPPAARRPAPRRTPGPTDPPDPKEPKDPKAPVDPPPARGQAPPQGNQPVVARPKAAGTWLGELRRCLRFRARDARQAIQRLNFCRDRMPKGAECDARCRVAKKKIDQKIIQLERRDAAGDEPRNQWLGRPGTDPYPGNTDPGYDNRSHRRYRRRPRRRGSPLRTVATVTTAIGAGVGLLGLGLWLYSTGLVTDRDKLMSNTPSPANTTAIIEKHDQAAGVQVAAFVSLSAAGAAILFGSLFFTIARRTSYAQLPPRRSSRLARTKNPPTPPSQARGVTLFSTGQLP